MSRIASSASLVPRARGADELAAGCVGAEQLHGLPVRGTAGRDLLEMAMARAVAAARRAAVLEHHVPDLGAGSDEPRYGLPSRISPPPTPVPSVSMTMSLEPFPAPIFHSAIAAAFAVVVERDRDGPSARGMVAEVEVGERDVDRADDAAGALVDRRREPEADRGRRVDPKLASTISSSTSRSVVAATRWASGARCAARI